MSNASPFTQLWKQDAERQTAKSKPASNEDSNLLAGQEKPASLLAKTEEVLASLPAKPASKLAEENKSASRSDAQRLADLKKSRGPRTQIAIRISSDIKREIDEFLLKHGITQQDFFELAASSFISKVLAELESKPASKLALDDRRYDLLFKTDTRIINLFREYNKILNPETKWKAKDDAVASRYNSVDLRVIEIGIIYTQSNYIESGLTEPPQSFKYYVAEIDKFARQGFPSQLLDGMLETGRKNWRVITGREVDLKFLKEPGK
jgi:hypothetical protein